MKHQGKADYESPPTGANGAIYHCPFDNPEQREQIKQHYGDVQMVREHAEALTRITGETKLELRSLNGALRDINTNLDRGFKVTEKGMGLFTMVIKVFVGVVLMLSGLLILAVVYFTRMEFSAYGWKVDGGGAQGPQYRTADPGK